MIDWKTGRQVEREVGRDFELVKTGYQHGNDYD